MKISFLTSLTLASSLVSAKLYVVNHSNGDEKVEVGLDKGTVVKRDAFLNDLSKRYEDEDVQISELRLDEATVDDLLGLGMDFFDREVLTTRQVIDLVINHRLRLFERMKKNKKDNKHEKKRGAKTNLLDDAVFERLKGAMEKLPEVTPAELGDDRDDFVAALPVSVYGAANPATILLSENAIMNEAAIATLFNLTEDMVKDLVKKKLGLDKNSLAIIKKVVRIVSKTLSEIIKFTGPDRIFKVIHQLAGLVQKVPVLGKLVGPRLEALGNGIVTYIVNLNTGVKETLKMAGKERSKLSKAAKSDRIIYEDLNALVFGGRSTKKGEQWVDQSDELNFTRKTSVNDDNEIEYDEDDSSNLPAFQNNNNNNNNNNGGSARFGRPSNSSRNSSRRHHRRDRHHNKSNVEFKEKRNRKHHSSSSSSKSKSRSNSSRSSSGSSSGSSDRF